MPCAHVPANPARTFSMTPLVAREQQDVDRGEAGPAARPACPFLWLIWASSIQELREPVEVMFVFL